MDENYEITAEVIAKLLKENSLVKELRFISADTLIVKTGSGSPCMIYIRTSEVYRRFLRDPKCFT